jgi:tetratricopeptide (TPR) repeat protein
MYPTGGNLVVDEQGRLFADLQKEVCGHEFCAKIKFFVGTGAMETRRKTSLILSVVLALAACSLLASGTASADFADDFQMGQNALRYQQWDRALHYFSNAIKGNPKFFPAYHARAIAYSRKGLYDKSIEDLKSTVQLNPDFIQAYGLLGVVYEIKKDYASALKVYRAALPRVKTPAAKRALKNWIADMELRLQRQQKR